MGSRIAILFSMPDVDHDLGKSFSDMRGKMFRAIHASVLSTRAAEAEGQTCETAFEIAGDMGVRQGEYVRQERLDLAAAFKKVDDGRVPSGNMREFGESSRICDGTTVEDVAAAMARFVGGIAFEVRERLDENV